MKRAVIVITVLAILGAIGAFAIFSLNSLQQKAPNLDKDPNYAKVERGELAVRVVESGTIDAVKSVEVRSRASGRLARLLVQEGDYVTSGQLIAVIDPQETQFRVQQDQAQLSGAMSGVARTQIEIEQSRITLREQLRQAEERLAIVRRELAIQPKLTNTAITQAKSQLDSAIRQEATLSRVSHPNERVSAQVQVDDAKNNLEISERELERQRNLEKQGYVAGRTVESAELQVQLNRSRLAVAQDELKRISERQKLERERANDEIQSSRAAYERAQANSIADEVKRREFQSAVSQVNQARASLRQVDALQKSKQQGQATVSQLSSVLADSRRQLRETQVRAPFSGVVTKRYIEVGDLVTALSAFSAGTAIVRIEDRSSLEVKLDVNEIDVARLKEDMTVKIDIDALPNKPLSGRIYSIAPASLGVVAAAQGGAAASSDAVVKYEVEVYLNDADPAIRTGMSAKCTIEVETRRAALKLPVAFVGKDEKGSYVMIPPERPESGKKPTRRAVQVGLSTGAFVEILAGLKEGERVVKPEYTGPPRTGMFSGGDE